LSLGARWNAEILALWVFAEVDLNRANFHRDTLIELTGPFDQKKSPYSFLPRRGINVKYFFNTLSDRLAISALPYSSEITCAESFTDDQHRILPVQVFQIRICQSLHLRLFDVAHAPGNLPVTGDLQSLPFGNVSTPMETAV
jgi:hypothetical protein